MWLALVGVAAAWEPGAPTFALPRTLTWCVAPETNASLTTEAQVAITAKVFDAWAAAAPCAGLSFRRTEGCREHRADITVWLGLEARGRGLPGVDGTDIFVDNDTRLYWIDDEAPPNQDGFVRLSTVVAYGVGVVLGLVDTCVGGVCDDRDAVMATQTQAYEWDLRAPTPDDGRSLVATYAPALAFACPTDVRGPTPLTVTCDADASGAFLWRWGDGGATDPTHTYTTPGRYAAVIRGADLDTCVWGQTSLDVLACAPNDTPFSAIDEGDHHIRLALGAPIVDPACVTDVQWTVSDARGEVFGAPTTSSAVLALPRGGTWTVRLDVDGVGGAASETREVEVARGCAAPAAPSSLLVVLAMAASRPRRRG